MKPLLFVSETQFSTRFNSVSKGMKCICVPNGMVLLRRDLSVAGVDRLADTFDDF